MRTDTAPLAIKLWRLQDDHDESHGETSPNKHSFNEKRMQSSHPQMSLVSPCFCSPSMAPCYCSDRARQSLLMKLPHWAFQPLTILQMDLASSENLWVYTSSVSSTLLSTSSLFTFSFLPRNGDCPAIIS